MSWLKSAAEPRRQRSRTFLPLAAVALSAGLLWHFHDRYWYPADDGNYAHVAERVAQGEVLNRDVQDIHAGYVNFLNAAALQLFGPDLLSMRYPLLAAALVQAILLLQLLAVPDAVLAFVASVTGTALGVIQFLNPTAHWYCTALTVALAFWMIRGPADRRWRLLGAGALVGLVALFRQLSGVWVGMGILTVALSEAADGATGSRVTLSRALVAVMLVVLAGYVASTREWSGALLIASPAAAILVWMLSNVRTSNRAAVAIVFRLGAGAILSTIPLLAYHLAHGSMRPWLGDVVGTAMALPRLEFFGQPWYAAAAISGLREAASTLDPIRTVNGLYWVALPVLPLVNGLGIIRRLRATGAIGNLSFPILVAFYSLVSLHFQIPIYLYYSAGLCSAAILWQIADWSPVRRYSWAAGTLALAAVAVIFHAAQPYTRTSLEILRGARRSVALVPGFERCSLQLDPVDREAYQRLVSLIRHEVPPGDWMFAVPSDAELYFLANRRNPFRFYNTALGIRNAAELAAVMDALIRHPPLLVTYRANDKYNTEASRAIMERVRATYDRLDTIGGIEVYRLRRSA